jgi:hypothetical protein
MAGFGNSRFDVQLASEIVGFVATDSRTTIDNRKCIPNRKNLDRDFSLVIISYRKKIPASKLAISVHRDTLGV